MTKINFDFGKPSAGGIVDQVSAPIRDDVKTALGAKEEEPAGPAENTGE